LILISYGAFLGTALSFAIRPSVCLSVRLLFPSRASDFLELKVVETSNLVKI